MRRFLVNEELRAGGRIQLSAEESRHALKSLRLGPGSPILLTDGRGHEADGRLLTADLGGAQVEIESVRVLERKAKVEVLQATLKGPKMDWLIEKLTELGVAEIRLAQSRYAVAAGEKIERWQRIAQAAVKQSGNSLVPSIHPARPLDEAVLALGEGGLRVLLQPGAQTGLAALVRQEKPSRVILAVGPEGGFAPEEERHLLEIGFRPAALSPQILRGETAAIVAAAVAAHSIDF